MILLCQFEFFRHNLELVTLEFPKISTHTPPSLRAPVPYSERLNRFAKHAMTRLRWFLAQFKKTGISILLSLFSHTVMSAEAITFKQSFSPNISWVNYGIAIIMLLVIVIVIAKKHKPNVSKKSICQLVEKKYLGNKTVVYVIDYQQQRFLLADNQHALAIHPLDSRDSNEQI